MDDEEVVQGAPLDGLDGKEMAGCEEDALPLLQTEESYGVIGRDGTDARQDAGLKDDGDSSATATG